MVKNLFTNAGDVRDTGLTPGSGKSPGGVSLGYTLLALMKSHRQRSLEGYSPCGRKELDTTENARKKIKGTPPQIHRAPWQRMVPGI